MSSSILKIKRASALNIFIVLHLRPSWLCCYCWFNCCCSKCLYYKYHLIFLPSSIYDHFTFLQPIIHFYLNYNLTVDQINFYSLLIHHCHNHYHCHNPRQLHCDHANLSPSDYIHHTSVWVWVLWLEATIELNCCPISNRVENMRY